MQKSGRKDVWTTTIEPNKAQIKSMLENGATEKQVCNHLHIAVSTWWKYKNEKPDFAKFLAECRLKPVGEITGAMFQAAVGFERTVKKAMKLKETEYEDGRKVRETEKIAYYDEIEYYPSNTTAAIFLLTNWAKDEYARDAAMLEIRKRELEIKEEQGGW